MPTRFKILIVEDNVIIADDLQQILEGYGYNVIGNVISFEKAVFFLDKNEVDLVLIDINLATEKTGIDLANYINNKYKLPFIYLTSNLDDKTVKEAAKTLPSAYLVKPFDQNTIYTSIELALTKFYNKKLSDLSIKEYLFLKKNNFYHKINVNDVYYIKSDNIYIEVFTKNNEKFLLRSTLKDFLKSLPSQFLRCNKSFIINTNEIKSFNLNYVYVKDQQISVSKEFKPYLKSLLT